MAPIPTENQIAKIAAAGLLIALTGFTSAAQGLDLQGHRGARGLMPENTLPGFAKALAIGVTTLELDLAVTADSKVVVSHNPRLEPEVTRYPNGDWLMQSTPPIHTMTLAALKSYDVGRLNPASEYAERYPVQQPVDGTSVPTLGEVFELVNRSGSQSVRFNIEIKINPQRPELSFPPRQFVRAVIDVVRHYNMQDRVAIQSFDWRALNVVQELAPEIATACLTVNQRWMSNLQAGINGPSPWLNGLDMDNYGGNAARAVKAAGGDIWSPFHREVDAESIKRAHELGLLVNVWTVNEPSRMRELIEMGVDGIITDYPDRLRQVMVEIGLPVPKPFAVQY